MDHGQNRGRQRVVESVAEYVARQGEGVTWENDRDRVGEREHRDYAVSAVIVRGGLQWVRIGLVGLVDIMFACVRFHPDII